MRVQKPLQGHEAVDGELSRHLCHCVTTWSLSEEALLLPVKSQSDGVFNDTDVACWNWR